jgi:hypothetical protein
MKGAPTDNLDMAISHRFAIGISSLCILSSIVSTGCGDGGSKDPKDPEVDRFAEAAALEASWCVRAQRVVAGFDDDSLPDSSVKQVTNASANDFISSRAAVEDDALAVQGLIVAYEGASDPAPEGMSRMIACKLRSQEAVESLLGVEASGDAQSCRALHEEAWEWALSQLTEAERERYEEEGHKLAFAPDVAASGGPQWIESNPALSADGEDFTLASSGLVSPGNGDFSDGTQGAVYCKLWSPAHMLYWLLVRAYDGEPLADEPEPPEPEPSMCMPSAPHAGSCTFLFAVAESHYCEDYTGSGWSAASGEAKCETRMGTYSAEPCSERKAETDTFDGDGVFKGQCVLKCGTPDEYIWNVYSGEGGSCPGGDWLPPDSSEQ